MQTFTQTAASVTGSAYDPYWSVMPPIMALYLSTTYPAGTLISFRFCSCLFLLLLWSFRLTWNWWQRLGKFWLKDGFVAEDWRYLDFKAQTSSKFAYWIVFSLGGFHLFPTILTFVGCMPLWYVVGAGSPSSGLSGWDIAGTCFMASSVILQVLSDRQMDIFLATHPKGMVCREGLWAVSRHPK